MYNNTGRVNTFSGAILRMVDNALKNMDNDRAYEFLQYLIYALADRQEPYRPLEEPKEDENLHI